ncbi:hypothetical protein A2899_00450 [Candidatus Amesbacteria bacterium RIFCSPLOWO2_01_FULL_49_25]|uniref:Uncharacterized protein n=1 Tax=Candidatus Amesbacteria bacterium RIFCSPHIGHO2_01_FULL_48_32b TaxID=1797253 RepID=A0A1F4YD22_9BACT|nr:MAG: hypothetical protein A2876_03890 [Candidatus Amesbacteria bacterium RIFCSPHIGHO2_01_FULL_48_32b]OGD07594.1 MAG: hypothetical protein A2899_00450 [Candidatus Amesbacteria bacterium RIFCSPLOWO2_01_FULL_49_25]
MRKRQKFVLTAVVVAGGVLGVQSLNLGWRYLAVGLLAVLSWVLSAWSLREGLSGWEWLTVLVPPAVFTAAVGLFYILLPQSWWAKLLVGFLIGIGEYAVLLTANIFSVAAIRTIALLRAAHAVGFVMTILTGFFLFDTVMSFRLDWWANGLLAAGVGVILIMPALWSVELLEKVERNIWLYSVTLGGCIGTLAMAVSFWPMNTVVNSLFLTTSLYVFLGVAQHHFAQRLFKRTIWEYLTVGVVVLVTMLATSGWGV